MEQSYDNLNNAAAAQPAPIPRPAESIAPRVNSQLNHKQRFGGMHLRRDKRFPFAQRAALDVLEAPPVPRTPAPIEADPLKSWKEAVMLWLSWNSTYEKVTAKMCKPGYDQKKIEALMDEMDKLRKRAIEVSEELLK